MANDVQAKNYRFAGFGFLCVAAVFFAVKMTALAVTFLGLGVIFMANSRKKEG